MQKQQGLGLIETIIVVTIIGILSAILIKKHVNTQTTANITLLHAMKASIESAVNLAYKKAAIANSTKKINGIVYLFDSKLSNSNKVSIRYGYPKGKWSELEKVLRLNSNDWHFEESVISDTSFPSSITLWSTLGRGSKDTCNLRYQGAIHSGGRPLITINTKGCQPI